MAPQQGARGALPVFWLGVVVGALVSPGHELDATFGSVEDVWGKLLSPAAGIALAILIRLSSSIVGLVLALPLMRAFDAAGRASNRYSGDRLEQFVDRLSTARGYRSLRFTHYVRDAAVARLGEASVRYERIDRALTVANFVLPVVTVLTVLVIALMG